MMDAKDIAGKVEAVQGLLSEKFGIKQRPLDKMLKKAGRRLPKRMHAKAQMLIKAQHHAAHPKLSRLTDVKALTLAYNDITAHLEAIDVAERTKGRVLSTAGAVVFNLLLVIAAFVVWLWWRGYV